MSSEKTASRLKEAADLLGMIEEILSSDLASRSNVSAGIKVTVKTAREAVIRSCVEVRRESTEGAPTAVVEAVFDVPAQMPPTKEASPPVEQPGEGLNIEVTRTATEESQERLLSRRRDLRASIDRMIERTGR